MIHEIRNSFVGNDFADGKLTFNTYVSDCFGPEEVEAIAAIAQEFFVETESEVGISCHFKLSDILDLMEDNFRYHGRDGIVMGKKDKPRFDALKAELQQMIERIDAIRFVEE